MLVPSNRKQWLEGQKAGSLGNVSYPIPVERGGTGATDAAGARTNLHAQQTLSEVASVGIGQEPVAGKALAVGGDMEVKGESLFLASHPIGSLFLTLDSTNPGTLFGGTWALVSAGRMLVGVDAADTDFNAAGKTGGSKYLQAHTHSHNHTHGLSEAFAGITAGYNSIAVALKTGVSWARSKTITGSLTPTESTASVSDAAQLFGSTDGVTDAAGTQQTGSTGAGGAGNLPPYYACYIWQRTA